MPSFKFPDHRSKTIFVQRILSKNVIGSRKAVNKVVVRKQLYIYGVPGEKNYVGNKIVDEIAKSAIHLTTESVHETLKSIRTLYSETFEKDGRRLRVAAQESTSEPCLRGLERSVGW